MSPESDLERLVRQQTLELEALRTALRQNELRFAAELGAAERLQQVATQLITARGTQALFEEILDAAVAIMSSDFATIQMLCPERGNGELGLLGHRGLPPEAAKHWEWVNPAMHTTCAEAWRTGRRVVAPDFRTSTFMAGSAELDEYLNAGIQAGQSTPLISRAGILLGMVSTHWREPHEPTAGELRALDILARLAADLIERSRADEKLRESEERFRRVFDEGPLGLALVGKDYRMVKANSAFCRMLGYDEEELLQRSFLDITHRDDLYTDSERADRLFRLEIPSYRIQKRYVTKAGRIIWANLTASIILGSGGEPLYGLGMVEDITEIKRTQEEALERQKLESLGTLAGGIAHDFNNLLGAIQAQAELAQSELAEGSFCTEELKSIQDVAMRAAGIVRQLMIYAGKETQTVELVSLTEIVKEMLPLIEISLSKHARLIADLDPDLPLTRASAAQLRQLAMNLVINASDAIGDRDGVIRVITSRMCLGSGSVAFSESMTEGSYLMLEVSDTGCGMSAETQARVFDPFFTTKSSGRGLGLAVVSGIVRSLGGEIHVSSELRKGTTFRVFLPCAETKTVSPNLPALNDDETEYSVCGCTVLVVEDEPVLRRAVVRKLRNTGFVVLEASDGSAAIDLLRTNADQIDVILLDMTIPGASSAEVIAKATEPGRDIRLLLTSAYSQGTLGIPSNVSQISEFLRKPFQLEDLVKSVRRALPARLEAHSR
jgi:PAS domain S-box-containing protein